MRCRSRNILLSNDHCAEIADAGAPELAEAMLMLQGIFSTAAVQQIGIACLSAHKCRHAVSAAMAGHENLVYLLSFNAQACADRHVPAA